MTLETADIQALVVRGYGKLLARFLLLEVTDDREARAYLGELADRIDRANARTPSVALQVAFTAPGLAALKLSDDTLGTFAREFLEGMDDDVRAVALGDTPKDWTWRGGGVHVMLMIYAHSGALQGHVDEERKRLRGLRVVLDQHTHLLSEQKEHFGWRDGLSMPVFEGVPKDRPRGKQQEWWTTPLKAGEFVLGYPNEYGCLSESPTANAADDPTNVLPVAPDGRKDLGKNGTYLVYREMTQEVFDLWDYLAKHSHEEGADRVEKAIALGAKMVGRWPGGAPLVTSEKKDDREHATDNEFTYAKDDPVGTRCPIGSHIRRANPRDALGSGRAADDSIVMVRKHQMIRRGRPFGPPVTPKLHPRDILAAPRDNERRGLHFMCLVGHISRQFEFVQRTWVQSANFNGLFKDGDPIAASRRPAKDPNPNDEFTCPAVPVRRKYKGMPQFTHVVGGAYFFLPGIRALRFLARLP